MVRLFFVILLLMLLTSSGATGVDSGTLDSINLGTLQLFDAAASGTIPLTVTFNSPFATVPAFAILLKEFAVFKFPSRISYVHTYGAITPTTAAFSVNKLGPIGEGSLKDVSVRWVASATPLLQLSPLTVTLDTTGSKVYDVPTAFSGASQLEASVTEVIIVSVISSFDQVCDTYDFYVSTGVAFWDGSNFVQTPSTLTVMQKTSLFGTNSPFFTSGGTNYVKMHTIGFSNTVIYATLLIHVVDASQTAASRIQTPSAVASPYTSTDSLIGPYNIDGLSPTAVRVFGIEAWYFRTAGIYSDSRMSITTSDGITATSYRNTDPNPGIATMREFYAFYPGATSCAIGCICDSNSVCVSCQPYRKMMIDSNGVKHCDTCLPGFYLTAASVCEQCPMNLNCATCAIASGATTATCTSCNCAQQRQLVGNQCVCIGPAYIEATPPVAYCVKA